MMKQKKQYRDATDAIYYKLHSLSQQERSSIYDMMGEAWVQSVLDSGVTRRDYRQESIDARGLTLVNLEFANNCDMQQATVLSENPRNLQITSCDLRDAHLRIGGRTTLEQCQIERAVFIIEDTLILKRCVGKTIRVKKLANDKWSNVLILDSNVEAFVTDQAAQPLKLSDVVYISHDPRGNLSTIQTNWASVPDHFRSEFNPPKTINIWSVGL